MAFTDSPWQSLVSTALIGTARQPWQPAIAPGQLGQMLAQLPAQSPETALLLTAAILSLHQRVGWQPETRPPSSLEPCALSDLPQCSPRASRCLQHILAGQTPQLLVEWLQLASIAQRRIPERLLPVMLDKGKQQRELRSAILPVLGQRGQWLAAQNPDWSYAVVLLTEVDWETGTTAARLLALQELRGHNPDRARDLLQATWSQEAAGDRVKFLATLETGLNLADELFLQQALGDRSREVRRMAVHLLSSLPGSRFGQAMAAHALQWVSLVRQATISIQVQLPEHLDDGLVQLGIEPKSTAATQTQLGEKACWLLQIIAATPLHVWTDQWQLSPEAIVQLTQAHEWQSVLLDGLALAAKRQQHTGWLEAICRFWLMGQTTHRTAALAELGNEDLVNALPRDRRDALLIDLFRVAHKPINDSLMIWLLRSSSHPWSVELAEQVLERLEHHLADHRIFSNTDWELRTALKEFARFIPVQLTPEVNLLCTRLNAEYYWIQSMNEVLEILQFRQEMTQAFGE